MMALFSFGKDHPSLVQLSRVFDDLGFEFVSTSGEQAVFRGRNRSGSYDVQLTFDQTLVFLGLNLIEFKEPSSVKQAFFRELSEFDHSVNLAKVSYKRPYVTLTRELLTLNLRDKANFRRELEALNAAHAQCFPRVLRMASDHKAVLK